EGFRAGETPAVPGGNRLPGGRDARGPRWEQASGRARRPRSQEGTGSRAGAAPAIPGGRRRQGGRDARGPRGEQASGRPQEGSCQVALFWQTVVAMMKAPLSISRRTFMTQSACAAALGAATLPMARSETAGKIKIGQIGTTHSHAAG